MNQMFDSSCFGATLLKGAGSWSSGYDGSLTRQKNLSSKSSRSPVQNTFSAVSTEVGPKTKSFSPTINDTTTLLKVWSGPLFFIFFMV